MSIMAHGARSTPCWHGVSCRMQLPLAQWYLNCTCVHLLAACMPRLLCSALTSSVMPGMQWPCMQWPVMPCMQWPVVTEELQLRQLVPLPLEGGLGGGDSAHATHCSSSVCGAGAHGVWVCSRCMLGFGKQKPSASLWASAPSG